MSPFPNPQDSKFAQNCLERLFCFQTYRVMTYEQCNQLQRTPINWLPKKVKILGLNCYYCDTSRPCIEGKSQYFYILGYPGHKWLTIIENNVLSQIYRDLSNKVSHNLHLFMKTFLNLPPNPQNRNFGAFRGVQNFIFSNSSWTEFI